MLTPYKVYTDNEEKAIFSDICLKLKGYQTTLKEGFKLEDSEKNVGLLTFEQVKNVI